MLGSAGIYQLVDEFAAQRARPAAAGTVPPEQHLMNLQVIPVLPNGVQGSGSGSVMVAVPPLHFQMVTAKLNVGTAKKDLAGAQLRRRSTSPCSHRPVTRSTGRGWRWTGTIPAVSRSA